jgi:hypothetical protein
MPYSFKWPRDQIFGTLATLAVLDGIPATTFPTFARSGGAEVAKRAKLDPDGIGKRMLKARNRYVLSIGIQS